MSMHRILVAYDGSEPARRALERAAEFASAMNATLTVVSVVPLHPDRVPVDPGDETAHEKALAEATRYLAGRGLSSSTLEATGDPGPAIVQVAEQGSFDAIVVGSRGRGTAARLVLGSVSEYVATHARATVIVVH